MSDEKPTYASVTIARCACKFLERAAAEPTSGIVWDELTGEFHIVRPNAGYTVLYHCPFCGGAAPPTKRGDLFATVTQEELHRLEALTRSVPTLDEVIERFGPPDLDYSKGVTITTPGTSEDDPPSTTSYRSITYKGLSAMGDVVFIDYSPAPVRVTFQGKYIGPPKSAG